MGEHVSLFGWLMKSLGVALGIQTRKYNEAIVVLRHRGRNVFYEMSQ